MTSATPNNPITSATNLMPSDNSTRPNVIRASPVLMSMPTMPSSKPSRIIEMARNTELFASTTAETSPSTINEK